MKKFTAFLPILLILVICVVCQTVMLTKQQFLPYPEPFGRESRIPAAAFSARLQPIGDAQFTYIGESSLTYATPDAAGQLQLSTKPWPVADKSQANNLKLTSSQAYWTESDHHIYTSHLQNNTWTAKKPLSNDEVTTFDVIADAQGDYLVWSDGKVIQFAQVRDQQLASVQSIPTGDVKLLKAARDKQGSLAIGAVIKSSDTSHDLWLFKAAAGTAITQNKVQAIELSAFMTVDELQIGLDSSNVYLFYEVASSKSMKTQVHYASLAWNTLSPISNGVLQIELGDFKTDQLYQPFAATTQQSELRLAVTANYVKNSRFSRSEPFLLTFKNGTQSDASLVSIARSSAGNPIYFVSEAGDTHVAWLSPLTETSFDVLYTTDNSVYKQQMNRLTSKDYIWSLKNVPLFIGMAFMVVLNTFKSFPLPYLYLFLLLFFKENYLERNGRLHFWIATGMYLVMKTIFIGDYFKPESIQNMPAFMQQPYSPYLVILVSFVFSYVCTRLWRKRLDDRYALYEFSYFVLLDVLLSTLWFAYFFTTVNI